MTIQDLIHTYDAAAWRHFSNSLKDKKYGLFKTTRFATLRVDSNESWTPDGVLDTLKIEDRSSDDVIVVSEKAFKQLQTHLHYNGEPILKQLDDGLFRYMQHIVLKCEDGARVQYCCYSLACTHHYHLDFIICSIDVVDVIE